MTQRQLKKLRRTELLEILLAQSREMDDLKKRLAEAEEKLKGREAVMAEADSLAAATAELKGLIELARGLTEQPDESGLEDEGGLKSIKTEDFDRTRKTEEENRKLEERTA